MTTKKNIRCSVCAWPVPSSFDVRVAHIFPNIPSGSVLPRTITRILTITCDCPQCGNSLTLEIGPNAPPVQVVHTSGGLN